MMQRLSVMPMTLGACLAVSACSEESPVKQNTNATDGGLQTNTAGSTTTTSGVAGPTNTTAAPSTTSGTTGGVVGSTTGGPLGGTTTGSGGATTGAPESTSDGSSTSGGTSTTDGVTSGTTGGTGGPTEGYPENTGAGCEVTAGEYGTDNPNLPNPFAMNDGTIISTMAEWACRRNEIKKDLEKYEVGPKPEPPEVTATLNGMSLSVVVTTDAGSITLTSNVSGSGSCVVIGMNGASNMVSGCTQVPFNAGQVVQVSSLNSDQPPDDPYYTVYPELWQEASNGGADATENGNLLVGSYSAWSWGISRIIDGLEQVKDELGVDTSKIAVHGCSYAGKMALWAGALDERIALTIAQESGGGGIPSWRLSEDFATRTGTDVEKIDNTNWSWFIDSMLNPPLNPHLLPHDHHELIAMIAPRALIALGNPTQSWLSDESGYKSLMAAQEVWKAMGEEAKFGFDFNTTQGHCQASSSQSSSVNAFVNKFLKDQEASTDIHNAPSGGGIQLNWEDAVDWETPAIE